MARVLFLTSSYPEAPEDGVCGYVHDLARLLCESHGHEVSVLAPGREGSEGDDRAFAPVRVERFRHAWIGRRRLGADSDMGAAIGSFATARFEAGPFMLAFAARAARAARAADVVCSHWLAPSGVVGAALRRPGRPHVAVAHGGDVHLFGRIPGGRRLARAVAERSDRIVFASAELAGRFARLAPGSSDRSVVVPMGADIGPAPDPLEVARLREESGMAGRTIALFVGRLVPVKGVDVLIEAASREPRLALWIAGDGPEAARLRKQAEAARLHASFFGRVDRLRRRLLLDACDVVVVPSRIEPGGRTEGMPVVCAEAFAAGKPVVASRVGGLAEAVGGGRAGLLVPPDDAEALAGALARLGADAGLARRLGASASQAAGRYSAAGTAASFDGIIRSIATGRKE